MNLDLSQFKGHTSGEWYASGEQEISMGDGKPTKVVYQVYRRYGAFAHIGTFQNEHDAKICAKSPDILAYARTLEIKVNGYEKLLWDFIGVASNVVNSDLTALIDDTRAALSDGGEENDDEA